MKTRAGSTGDRMELDVLVYGPGDIYLSLFEPDPKILGKKEKERRI
jgi:hypothetical protein